MATLSESPATFTCITDPSVQLLCDLLRLDEQPIQIPLALSEKEFFDRVNWDALLQRALEQSLGALLHKNIKLHHPELPIRPDVLQILHQQHLREGLASLTRVQALEKILRAFQAQNIPVIALKGIHLAEAVYADSTVRPMVDVDLLVHPAHLDAAAHILTRIGYQPSRQFWIEHEMRFSHEMPVFLKSGFPPVELHWTLLEPVLPFKIDLDEIWQRSVPVTIAGIPILGLSAEDLLLHLCVHASTQHRFRGALRTTYDIALTILCGEECIDWQVFVQRAQQWKAAKAAHLMLTLAHTLFGAPLSENILHELQPGPQDTQALEIACELLFPRLPEKIYFAPNLAGLVGIQGFWEKARFIMRHIFISPTELSRRYPVLPNSPRILLYYPVHLHDLIRKHLLPTLRLVRGDPEIVASAQSVYNLHELENRLLQKLTQ